MKSQQVFARAAKRTPRSRPGSKFTARQLRAVRHRGRAARQAVQELRSVSASLRPSSGPGRPVRKRKSVEQNPEGDISNELKRGHFQRPLTPLVAKLDWPGFVCYYFDYDEYPTRTGAVLR